MRRTGPIHPLPVALLLFGSGFSALVYQIAWQREFRMIFGSSTAASAAVLTIFIGGLGAGGLVLGKRADAHLRPLRLYAGLELLIAAFAAVTPPLLDLARAAYIGVGGRLTIGATLGTATRLVLAALVLAAPTLLMGGTLPAAVRASQSDTDAGRRSVGLLYGANTLGAVTGSLLSTFFLLERLGTRQTLWFACLINAAIALIALEIGRNREREPSLPANVTAEASGSRSFVLIASGAVGFAFFLLELVWYRTLGPLLGGSVFTFGLILAVALLGIGAGGLAYALFGGKRPKTVRGFAITCLLEALAVAIPFAIGDRIPLLTLALRPAAGTGLFAYLPGWLAVTSIVVFPAAFVAGAQYPLLISLLGRGGQGVGSQVGAAAACNTAGAMIGSLSGGFLLLPLLSATGCWRAAAAILIVLAVAALVIAARAEPPPPPRDDPDTALRRWAPNPRRWIRNSIGPVLAILTIAALAATGPTAAWRHSPIGAGRVDRGILESPNAARRWWNEVRRSVYWEADGVESAVALDATDGYAMVVNGKIDGNARGDAPTQVMGGLLGALLHPHPKSAMVIGLGTGSTAGWLGAVPSIERVDVAELEASMLRVARDCATVNQDVLSNPKVRIILGDARETLLTIPSRYDVIFSEPSNPYRAGVASLFTLEYYRAIASRLEQGGLFLQWVQLYEIDPGTVRTIYATMHSVFPTVESWQLGTSDLVIVASATPLSHNADAIRSRAAVEPYKSALAVAWRTEGLEGVLAHYVARPASVAWIALGGEINTDDQNRVEFSFARHVGDFARVDALVDDARERGEDRPELSGGPVDWPMVQEERIMQAAAESIEPTIKPGLSVDLEVRAQAAVNYVSGNLSGALAKWQFQEREPIGVTEISLVAEGMAETANAGALPLIERLRKIQPIEADTVLARLRFKQGKREEATTHLINALIAFRSDPWPATAVMKRALELAGDIAEGDGVSAKRLLDVLHEPFAVRSVDQMRLQTERWCAHQIPDSVLCAPTWERIEPNVPWDPDSLLARRDCYQRAGSPRYLPAARDEAKYTTCTASPKWLSCL